MQSDYARLVRILGNQVPRVFAGHGLVLEPAARELSAHILVASVGFGGRDLRGAVTIAASTYFWDRTAKAILGVQDASPELISDVAGELCNMILAGFRNTLLRSGVELACGTPTTVTGAVTDLNRMTATTSEWCIFASEYGGFHVRFDATLREGFELSLAEGAAIEPATEDLFF